MTGRKVTELSATSFKLLLLLLQLLQLLLLLLLHGTYVRAGIVMMLLRFITVTSCARADNVHVKIVKILSLVIGTLATLFLSFVANFPEDHAHGVGLTHVVSAGILFTGGCAFIVFDTIISLRMRVVEITDVGDQSQQPARQHWLRALLWFHWLRLIVALLSICALVLCKLQNQIVFVA